MKQSEIKIQPLPKEKFKGTVIPMVTKAAAITILK